MSRPPPRCSTTLRPRDEESLLLDDLVALVALGLLEERPSPAGPVYALTDLGRGHRREFRARRLKCRMCRNIRQLHNFEPPATDDEVQAAALQYVRKISGSTKPSQANADGVRAAPSRRSSQRRSKLLDHLVTNAPPKNREEEAAKAERARRPVTRPSRLTPVGGRRRSHGGTEG